LRPRHMVSWIDVAVVEKRARIGIMIWWRIVTCIAAAEVVEDVDLRV
jgi:hypothetical protein